MRKKIFIIHGVGQRCGLGREAGGDLDTIASNAFYGAWVRQLIREQTGREAEYGTDYEFDFVNYSEGLAHLAVHRGCDVYLPDFPIDALPPRLVLRPVADEREIDEILAVTSAARDVRIAAAAVATLLTDKAKQMVNETLQQRAKALLPIRSYAEIRVARLMFECTNQLLRAVALLPDRSEEVPGAQLMALLEWLGPTGQFQLRRELFRVLEDKLKWELQDAVDQRETAIKLAVYDAARTDFGSRGRAGYADVMMSSIVESFATAVRTWNLIPLVRPHVAIEWIERISAYSRRAGALAAQTCGDLDDRIGKLAADVPAGYDQLSESLHHARAALAGIAAAADDLEQLSAPMNPLHASPPLVSLQVLSDSSGDPVVGIDITFQLEQGTGAVQFGGDTGQRVTAVTDGRGFAAVEALGCSGPFIISATHNEQDYVKFSSASVGDDDEGSGTEIEILADDPSVLADALEDDDKPQTGRALALSLHLLEQQIRALRNQDVRLIRVDDHHPYTPDIRALLDRLTDEGLIEAVQLAANPRGTTPYEPPSCGADLIFDTLVAGTAAETPGLARLRHLAHLQDLHLGFDPLALELSKLIGSKANKVEMAHLLSQLNGEQDIERLMDEAGWSGPSEEYEDGLARVLPRVFSTLTCLHFLRPGDELPDSGARYALDTPVASAAVQRSGPLGWLKSKMGKAKPESSPISSAPPHLTDLKPFEKYQGVHIYSAVSPFCSPKKGEPPINVASALNFLKPHYKIDYFFYCYGSMLMTTRRVNPDSYRIDLSQLVAYVGSPSDGGHPEAATGRPSANPSFPTDRLAKVNVRNHEELLFHIATKVEECTGLRLNAILPAAPPEYSHRMREQILRQRRSLALAVFPTSGGVPVRILIALQQAADPDYEQISPHQMLSELAQVAHFHYLFICYRATTVVLRNVNDTKQLLDLPALARGLGTPRDGGQSRAASCQPRFHPNFPLAAYKWVNDANFLAFATWLAQETATLAGAQPADVTVTPVLPDQFDSRLEDVLQRFANHFYRIRLSELQPTLDVFAVLAPRHDREQGEPAAAAHHALAYLLRKGAAPSYLFYFHGARQHVLLNVNDQTCAIDLAQFGARAGATRGAAHVRVAAFEPRLPAQFTPLTRENLPAYLQVMGKYLKQLTGRGNAAVDLMAL